MFDIILRSPMFRNVASKAIAKLIRKKLDKDVDVLIHNFKVTEVNEDVEVYLTVTVRMSENDLKIMLDDFVK